MAVVGIVSVDDAFAPEASVTKDGVTKRGRPNGEENAETVTTPEKPLRLVTRIINVPVIPWGMDRNPGLAAIVKSGVGLITWTDKRAEWDSDPLVPVTVTV